MTSFCKYRSAVLSCLTIADLRWQLQNLTLKATKKVWAQSVVELLYEIFSQFLMFLLESLEIPPLVRIKEVHEVE